MDAFAGVVGELVATGVSEMAVADDSAADEIGVGGVSVGSAAAGAAGAAGDAVGDDAWILSLAASGSAKATCAAWVAWFAGTVTPTGTGANTTRSAVASARRSCQGNPRPGNPQPCPLNDRHSSSACTSNDSSNAGASRARGPFMLTLHPTGGASSAAVHRTRAPWPHYRAASLVLPSSHLSDRCPDSQGCGHAGMASRHRPRRLPYRCGSRCAPAVAALPGHPSNPSGAARAATARCAAMSRPLRSAGNGCADGSPASPAAS